MLPEHRQRVEEAHNELLWRKYQRDERSFLEDVWHIATTDGRRLLKLRPAQAYALIHWFQNRYSLTLKARQIGWTTLVGAHAYHSAIGGEGREIIFLSRGEREAKKIKDKVDYGIQWLPKWFKDRAPSIVSNTQEHLVFANGSSITSMPSAKDPARGSTAWLVVVDEWAFLPNPEEAWSAIEPVADIGGRIIGLSTANGSGNFFHELWTSAETGNNLFAPMFFPWSANEDRDADWYEAKSGTMSEWQMAQEYPTTPEEAFIKSGRPYLDLDALQQQTANVQTPEIGVLLS